MLPPPEEPISQEDTEDTPLKEARSANSEPHPEIE